MQKIDRRQLLKAAALGAAGTAAAALPIVAGTVPASAATPSAASLSGGRPNVAPQVAPTTAGTTYRYLTGATFKPTNSSEGYTSGSDVGYIRPGTSVFAFLADVDVPSGAVITECIFDLIMNDAGGSSRGFIIQWFPDSNTFGADHNAVTTTQSAAVQRITVAVTPPFAMDTSQAAVQLAWLPSAANANHELKGARVGWIHNPGLVTFSGPRRVYGNGTVLAPGQSVTGIDATKQLDGVTPSGVPAGATAAFCAVSSYGTGVISLYPDGTADNGIGAWASQGTAGNGVNQGYNLVPLSAAGKFSFTNYFTSKAMYFDVWGYLV